ncbi:MAG: GNAT family protein [Paracoccaceae bacterium]
MSLRDQIETERLTLRRPRLSDSGPMSLYAGDRRVAEMLEHVPHPYPPGAAEAFIARADRSAEHVWVMDAAKIDGPEFIGVISVKPKDEEGRLGYWVGPPFWGTGYASEAALAIVAAATAAGLTRLEARIVVENEPSAHVLVNAGFREAGRGDFYSVARGAMTAHRLFALDLGGRA